MAKSARKVYFIKGELPDATVSGKWRNTLKQTYKSSDAIRDIIQWTKDGREFYVSLRDHRDSQRRVCYHVNSPSSSMATNQAARRPVVGVIDMILQWTSEGFEFDIVMLERIRPEQPSVTVSGRLPLTGSTRN